jgi:hypothetical protein
LVCCVEVDAEDLPFGGASESFIAFFVFDGKLEVYLLAYVFVVFKEFSTSVVGAGAYYGHVI